MKGVHILGGREIEVAETQRPGAEDGWVVVCTTASAVCGSDLHHYRQDSEKVGQRAGRIAGHELVGVIEEVGAGVKKLSPGMRVIAYQHYGCGMCVYCHIGEPMFCSDRQTLGNHFDGSDAEYVALPAVSCLVLPDDISDPVATLISCSLGTAYSGVRKLGVSGDEIVVVFGLGPVGCCAVAAASDKAKVIAVDPVESRRELAEKLGASATVDPTVTDTKEAVFDMTGGMGAEGSIDCSGNPQALSEALGVLRPLGKMVILAATSTWEVDPDQVRRGGHTLMGSWVFAMSEYEMITRFARRKASLLEGIITHTFPGSNARDAFRAADGAAEGKILIDWA